MSALLSLALLITRTLAAPMFNGQTSNKRIVGYYGGWTVYQDYPVSRIPADQLTHVVYGFVDIGADNRIRMVDAWGDIGANTPPATPSKPFGGNFHQLNNVLKPANPHLKTLLAVGGWTLSKNFSYMAGSSQNRSAFIQSCLQYVDTYGFDGIDLDWEYPVDGGDSGNAKSPEDGRNYVNLVRELKAAFGNRLVSVALPASGGTRQHIRIAEMAPHVDFATIMTYDYTGATWSPRTGHQTPLFANPNDPSSSGANAAEAMQAYVAGGMPKDKLQIGGAAYGVGFANAASTNNGLFQTYNGKPRGTRDTGNNVTAWTGIFEYKDLVTRIKNGQLTRFWDATARAAYAYNPTSRTFVSYDDVASIQAKADYVNQQNLGGMTFWQLSGDTRYDQDSLIQAAFNKFARPQPPSPSSTPVRSESSVRPSSTPSGSRTSSAGPKTTPSVAPTGSVSSTGPNPTSSPCSQSSATQTSGPVPTDSPYQPPNEDDDAYKPSEEESGYKGNDKDAYKPEDENAYTPGTDKDAYKPSGETKEASYTPSGTEDSYKPKTTGTTKCRRRKH